MKNFYSVCPSIGFNIRKFDIGYEFDDGRGHSPWIEIYIELYIISFYLKLSKIQMH